MRDLRPVAPFRILSQGQEPGFLALGTSVFGWSGQDDADSLSTMEAALACGMNHIDTAASYGGGHSERLVSQFLKGRRDRVIVATKGSPREVSADGILKLVDDSLQRLQTDWIDLYYVHWPVTGRDMRPLMEGLEKARRQGKIRAIGVSNFSVQQMEQVAEVGSIDAHQLCYNLFWRRGERGVIPYCRQHGIAVMVYNALARGILTGKFGPNPHFEKDDLRLRIVFFEPDVWPYVYNAVELLKPLARDTGRPMAHLALRWLAGQAGVTSIVTGARTPSQVEQNAAAMRGEIPLGVIERMTEIGDGAMPHIPEVSNIFRYDR